MKKISSIFSEIDNKKIKNNTKIYYSLKAKNKSKKTVKEN